MNFSVDLIGNVGSFVVQLPIIRSSPSFANRVTSLKVMLDVFPCTVTINVMDVTDIQNENRTYPPSTVHDHRRFVVCQVNNQVKMVLFRSKLSVVHVYLHQSHLT